MSGGPKYEYYWADGDQYKKPTALSAPAYIGLLMDWVEVQVSHARAIVQEGDGPIPTSISFGG